MQNRNHFPVCSSVVLLVFSQSHRPTQSKSHQSSFSFVPVSSPGFASKTQPPHVSSSVLGAVQVQARGLFCLYCKSLTGHRASACAPFVPHSNSFFHSAIILLKHESHQTRAQNSSMACYYTQNHTEPLTSSGRAHRTLPLPPLPQPQLSSAALPGHQVITSSGFFPTAGPVHTPHPLKHSSTLYTATSNSFFIFGTFSKSFPSIKLNQTTSQTFSENTTLFLHKHVIQFEIMYLFVKLQINNYFPYQTNTRVRPGSTLLTHICSLIYTRPLTEQQGRLKKCFSMTFPLTRLLIFTAILFFKTRKYHNIL